MGSVLFQISSSYDCVLLLVISVYLYCTVKLSMHMCVYMCVHASCVFNIHADSSSATTYVALLLCCMFALC